MTERPPSEPISVVMQALPASWRIVASDPSGRAAQQRSLCVIETLNREADGRRWHHVSVSCPTRIPTYDELQLVRRLFIGEDAECYQVFPPRSRYVNDHPYVLHLWRCLDAPDGAVLPDFRHEGSV